MAPPRIGPFVLVREIGRGGMGVVYLARDERLGRDVAIKALPEGLAQDRERVARFEREAQSLARLSHPNVATIYGLEEHGGHLYLVLEHVDGEDLAARLSRGPLPIEEAIEIACQIADALATAHEQQIIHRDIKPANIMVNTRGQAKMLDFGLAKFLPGSEPEGAGVTRTGAVVGTFHYMSPEQAHGKPVDARADLFALGAVLYEMVTGRKSFDGSTPALVFDAVLNRAPQRASSVNRAVPPALEQVIDRALRKDPDERYSSAAEMRADLERARREPGRPPRRRRIAFLAVAALVAIGATLFLVHGGGEASAAGRIRLAVLPLHNIGTEPEQEEYFAEGMTDEIITALGRLRSDRLAVVGRTTSMRFHDADELRKSLKVDFVVDGTVKRHEDTVYVNIELIDARDLAVRRSLPFEGEAGNLPRLQREIARRLARELAGELLPDMQMHYEPGPEAHDRYLWGLHWLYKGSPGDWPKAAEAFEEATSLEPDFALAHAGAARALAFWATFHTVPSDELRPRARHHAAAAIKLEQELPEAHTATALVRFLFDWDLEGARRSFEYALELNPTAGDVHHWYGHLLALLEGNDAAVAEFRKALELDELSPFDLNCMALHQIFGGHLEDAERSLKSAADLAPTHVLVCQNQGLLYEHRGELGKATAAWKDGFDNAPSSWAHSLYGYGLGRECKTDEARAVLSELKAGGVRGDYVSHFALARVCAGLGDKDEAFEELERAREEREVWLICLPIAAGFGTLRDDPRYRDLLRRLGVPR